MSETLLGYCTNVHPAGDLDALRASLDRHAVRVREHLAVDQLPLGLWFSDHTARQLEQPGETLRFRGWLRDRGLSVLTLNGFPQHDFHQPVVKHAVYRTPWWDPDRSAHTLRLASLLALLADNPRRLSISTLPLGWAAETSDEHIALARRALIDLAQSLAELERRTRRHVAVDLEPEPGCALDRSDHVIRLFEHLTAEADPAIIRRHLGVCHDTCHAAVMGEDQATVIRRYHDAGITIGKVQVSSAITATHASREALRPFAEPRYLHQTRITTQRESRLLDDLPQALGRDFEHAAVHFHVPVFLEAIGELGTTRADIAPALAAARRAGVTTFEVETYAWPQLPKGVWDQSLEAGIAEELRFTRHLLEHDA